MDRLLTVIVLLPLAGFLLNGLFGNRLGKRFVSVVGCGLPLLAFAASEITGADVARVALAGAADTPRWSRPPIPGPSLATARSRSRSTSIASRP